MKQPIIYALDFDGVICDSVLETGIAAWKAASQLWDDFDTELPSHEYSTHFRQIRPIMGTGYEAVLIARMLNNGDSVSDVLADYAHKKQQILDESQLAIKTLQKVFGETRDHWINEDIDTWVAMNPLFDEVVAKLQHLSQQGTWYIVTTKQERFVKKILDASGIHLAPENLFGLDRNKTKAVILEELVNQHQGVTIRFVEDMLPSLLKVNESKALAKVELFLASWGYNTPEQRDNLSQYPITLINMDEFLV